MVKLVVLIAIVLLVVRSYFSFSHVVISRLHGPSTSTRIDRSFTDVLAKKYEMIVLGNSKIIQDINPQFLPFPAYNFAHNNDGMNQCYFKLRYLQKEKYAFKYLVLGVDYCLFTVFDDSRNYCYNKWFEPAYSNDYKADGSISLIGQMKTMSRKFNEALTIHISNTFQEFIRGLYTTAPQQVPFMRENGQYVEYGVARPDDFVYRDNKPLPLQLEYFHKVIEHCRANGIYVFMVLPPMRENERKAYAAQTVTAFDSLFVSTASAPGVKYLDFTSDTRFTINDYVDFAHMNEKGADRFSAMLGDTISTLLKQHSENGS
jgi:hypothetical protein